MADTADTVPSSLCSVGAAMSYLSGQAEAAAKNATASRHCLEIQFAAAESLQRRVGERTGQRQVLLTSLHCCWLRYCSARSACACVRTHDHAHVYRGVIFAEFCSDVFIST